MPLIKDIAQLAKIVPVMHSLDFDEVLPFILRAERSFLIPEIGKEIYEELIDAIEAATEEAPLSDINEELLSYMQIPVGQYAMFLYSPVVNVIVGASGLTQDFSEGRKPAFPKDVEKMNTAYLDGAHQGIDDLIEYLQENLEDFPTWQDTDAHKASLKYFVNNAAQFQEYFNIGNRRRTFVALKSIMRDHDRDMIINITGEALYAEIKQEIFDQDISEANKILLDFIRAAIVHATVADAIDRLNVDVNPDFGLTIIAASSSAQGHNKDNRQAAPDNSLSRLRTSEQLLSNKALDKLKTYLEEHSDEYPLYLADPEASTENKEEEKFTNNPDSGIFFA